MLASVLNDTIWLPVALALPMYAAFLFWGTIKSDRIGIALFSSMVLVLIAAIINFTMYFRFMFLLIVVFFVFLVIFTRRYAAIRINCLMFAIALLGLILHYRLQLLPDISFGKKTNDNNLSILDYNILVSQRGDKREPIINLINERNPDIVFIQEINSSDRQLFRSRLGVKYPYQLWADRFETYNGGVILSKYPFTRAQNIDLKNDLMKGHTNINYAVIRFQGRDIHLLNCHLYPSGHAMIQLIFGRRTLNNFIVHTRNAYLRRIREAEQLAAFAATLEGPVIMAGDFNDTPNSKIHRLFSQRFNNTFARSGWGLGTTFGHYSLKGSASPRWHFLIFDFLRIDHVFLSPHFKATSAQVLPIDASDHRPVICEVALRRF